MGRVAAHLDGYLDGLPSRGDVGTDSRRCYRTANFAKLLNGRARFYAGFFLRKPLLYPTELRGRAMILGGYVTLVKRRC
jgi:hypothetical protein